MREIIAGIDSEIVKATDDLETSKSKYTHIIPVTEDVLQFLTKVSAVIDSSPQENKMEVCIGAMEQLRSWSVNLRGDIIRNVIKHEERIQSLQDVRKLVIEHETFTPSKPPIKDY